MVCVGRTPWWQSGCTDHTSKLQSCVSAAATTHYMSGGHQRPPALQPQPQTMRQRQLRTFHRGENISLEQFPHTLLSPSKNEQLPPAWCADSVVKQSAFREASNRTKSRPLFHPWQRCALPRAGHLTLCATRRFEAALPPVGKTP
jgi:hypothetical protein